MPKVSVIIPNYNHGEFLREAIASVAAMNRDDVELIVVDDGSTDERTRKEIDALEAKGIRVIRQENKGPAAARNGGILASKGQYILPLDADDRVRPNYIEHGVRILDANPKVGIIYGDAERIAGKGTDPRRPLGLWEIGPFSRSALLRRNYIPVCALYRRIIWEQNGGYDHTMPVQLGEDWDFWVGAVEHGWEFHYIPEIVFEYRVSADSLVARTRGCGTKIERFVALKHGPLYRQAWLELLNERDSCKATDDPEENRK
jgi:glycosyltransferase involved in cell wall biosynthesis